MIKQLKEQDQPLPYPSPRARDGEEIDFLLPPGTNLFQKNNAVTFAGFTSLGHCTTHLHETQTQPQDQPAHPLRPAGLQPPG